MGGSRRFSVHHTLGGGSVADALLWRRSGASVASLVSSTIFWFLFERAGYNLVSFVANVFLLLIVILFLWAKSATVLNRPLPPLPELEVSQKSLIKIADVMRVWTNKVLLIAKQIAVDKNIKRFLEVVLTLWLLSFIGSLFNLLTLFYIGFLLCLFVPFLYDKYQDQIEEKLILAVTTAQSQYRKVPPSLSKDKKTQ